MKAFVRFFIAGYIVLSSGLIKADTTLVSFNDEWRYFDQGFLPSVFWKNLAYNDASWSSGNGEFGYGDGDEATIVSYGPNPSNKYITTYFRKKITIANPATFASYHLNLKRDDGAVVYINGTEVFRSNMPSGTIGYSTLASTDCVDDGNTPQTVVLLPSAFASGNNVIAVEIHQYTAASSDVSFDMELIAYNYYVPLLLRQPYLQMVTDTSITLRWRTNTPCLSQVWYGNHPDSLIYSLTDSNLVTDHEIRLYGLVNNSRYFYALSDGVSILQGDSTNYFTTAPSPGTSKPTRIWVMGDTGVNTVDQNTVRDAFLNYNGNQNVDLLLMLGDNAYNSGTDQEYQNAFFQNHYEDILKNTPLLTIAGNHENYTANALNQTGPYYDIFNLPKNGECGGVPSGTEAYYSFDYGQIHIIGLEVNTPSLLLPGSAMLTWLANDLNATTRKWRIVMLHNSPYTKGGHDSDTENDLIQIRQQIMPILDQYKVDLVLCGHNHVYERSYLMEGHYGNSASLTPSMIVDSTYGTLPQAYLKKASKNYKGLVVVQAGCSGVVEAVRPDWPHPAMRKNLNQNLGSLTIDIDNDSLTLRFIDNSVLSPQVLDEFSIVKACDITAQISVPVSRVCINDDPMVLNATPSGGIFTGSGMNDSVFNPLVAGAGSHVITYTYSNAQGCHISDSKLVEVVAGPPPQPFSIITANQVCPPSQGETARILSVADAESYLWTASSGIVFTSPLNDTIVQFNVNQQQPSYQLQVVASNLCGNSIPQNMVVNTVRYFPVGLTGSSLACAGDTLSYSVNVLNNLSTYWWNASSGIGINGQNGISTSSNSLQVSAVFDSSFYSGTICVANKEACLRNVSASCMVISGKPVQPSLITGPSSALPGNTGIIYSVNPVAGAIGYQWTVPAGCQIISGQNSNVITVDFNSGFSGGIIGVKALSNCDESAESKKMIRSYNLQLAHSAQQQNRTMGGSESIFSPILYPNPANDYLILDLNDEQAESVVGMRIYDLSGKEIINAKTNFAFEKGKIQIDIEKLPQGMYTLLVITQREIKPFAFVKKGND